MEQLGAQRSEGGGVLFYFIISNKSNITDERKEGKIQGINDDEQRKAETPNKQKRNQDAILREEFIQVNQAGGGVHGNFKG